ncbi:MAG TPA: TlyA family RNA methyltransferase [Rhizomicrobium sp.]|jgi:23S rRNA (cytidine1920-2'-O)/16S rRNA (cytidine1409-2'-O)-methyltransferase|nr:TlyA family RNA methyltransferase [Rhizomicrobium sp.]
MPLPSLRADVFLVEHGYARTRQEAQEAIEAGKVFDGGRRVIKPSQHLNETSRIKYERAHPFVSRGALKLAGALKHFDLTPQGRVCLDLGASTGGFSEVLLMHDATKVFAVDVGHGQLDPKIAKDPRVVNIERTNARDLKPLSERPQAIVADLSFISLKLALPPALSIAAQGAWLIALVKPQFEAGKENIGKGGIVRDAAIQDAVLADIVTWLPTNAGWSVIGAMESPVKGGDGNREFLIAARKS